MGFWRHQNQTVSQWPWVCNPGQGSTSGSCFYFHLPNSGCLHKIGLNLECNPHSFFQFSWALLLHCKLHLRVMKSAKVMAQGQLFTSIGLQVWVGLIHKATQLLHKIGPSFTLLLSLHLQFCVIEFLFARGFESLGQCNLHGFFQFSRALLLHCKPRLRVIR